MYLDVLMDKNKDYYNFREVYGIPEEVSCIFNFRIPYAIPIMDGKYTIKWESHDIELEIQRIQATMPPKQLITGPKYYQRPFDKYGHSAFSKIIITIPWYVDVKEKEKSSILFGNGERTKAKEMLVSIVNLFIEKVKYFMEEFWLESIRYQDLDVLNVLYRDEEKSYGQMTLLFDTGLGPVTFTSKHPFLMDEEIQKELESFLKSDIEYDLSKIFLFSVKNECLKGDYRHALIEAVIALEYTLYNFIKSKGDKYGLSEKKMDELVKNVGLKDSISVLLRLVTEGKNLPAKSVMQECMSAITIRNKIVHSGYLKLDQTETERQIIAIEKIINHIKKMD